MTFPFTKENAESRQRLATLVRGLSEADLARSTHYGWKVAALLAHLAFWDQRMVVILKRWKEEGFDPSPIDAAAVNDALTVICHALEPRTAIELALSAAEQIDAEPETLTRDSAEHNEAHIQSTLTPLRIKRSLLRDGHINDIELLLQQEN